MRQKQKPKFLNLLQIHLPVTGVASIAHRISGALLFLAIPALIYWFGRSLHSAQGFEQLRLFFDSGLIKLPATVLLWATIHHLLAGIRFLLLDLNVGAKLRTARGSAWVVNIASILLLILIAAGVWL